MREPYELTEADKKAIDRGLPLGEPLLYGSIIKKAPLKKTAAVTHGGFLIWEGSSTNQTAAVAGGWIQNGRHCWRPRGNNVHRDEEFFVLGRPGSDLLFQALRLSTIGAEEFNGRVRDGIGW